jgi:MscS family membrane protein
MMRGLRTAAPYLVVALLLAAGARAEQPTLKDLLAPQAAGPSPTAGGAAVPTGPPSVGDRSTPRATVTGFLAAANANEWARATHFLNLAKLPKADGVTVAHQLKTVLDRELWIEPTTLSADPAGYRADDLPSDRDLVGWIDAPGGPEQILVTRGSENGTPIWRFAPETVARVPALADALGYRASRRFRCSNTSCSTCSCGSGSVCWRSRSSRFSARGRSRRSSAACWRRWRIRSGSASRRSAAHCA